MKLSILWEGTHVVAVAKQDGGQLGTPVYVKWSQLYLTCEQADALARELRFAQLAATGVRSPDLCQTCGTNRATLFELHQTNPPRPLAGWCEGCVANVRARRD